MYSKQLKETNTITWHNLQDKRSMQEFKTEVMATIKTIKAIETVVNYHRIIRQTA